ncbi:MAG: hypothetical protein NTV06_05425, partial [candidate division Zixibacteria bacterium]|nr:hypothetical protein [candidate division Zixibacteria bacterium]
IMDKDKLEEIRYRTFQNILEMERVQREDNYSTNESAICNWCIYYKLCPAKRHRVAIESDLVVEFDKDRGRELAERYLKLSGEKKVMASEIEALKEDIIRFMKEVDINRLDAPNGHVKLSLSGATEAFPTKTNDEVAYLEISLLTREAGLDECFILDGNILYKEFYLGEKLPEELRKKFQQYIINSKQKFSIRPHYKNQ